MKIVMKLNDIYTELQIYLLKNKAFMLSNLKIS